MSATASPATAGELRDRVAVITGGAGGFGVAIARRLGRFGARIVLADIREDAAQAAAMELAAAGIPAVGAGCDVSQSAAADALAARVLKEFGRVDILVNNAGFMGRVAPLWDLTDADWNSVMAVDLTSVFLVTRAFIRPMRAQRRGAIVSIASIAGKEGTPQLIPYSVAKAGIIAFTKALGKEAVDDGIRVNCVAPGVVQTPLLDQLPAESTQVMLSKVPMKRFGTADEVAAVVHFLASDDASFITAQCFDASGGRATF